MSYNSQGNEIMNRLSVDSVGQSQRCIAIVLHPSRQSQVLVTTFTKSGNRPWLLSDDRSDDRTLY